MPVRAFVTVGGQDYGVLLPNREVMDVASQLGYKPSDLFSVNHRAGMSRWTSIKFLIQVELLSAIYDGTASGISFTINDGTDDTANIVWTSLYALPPQPLLWRQVGGCAIVELVDERYYWQFTAGANERFIAAYSSDGRWLSFSNPSPTFADIVSKLDAFAATLNLTKIPSAITVSVPSSVGTRVLSDVFAYHGSNLGLVYDMIAAVNGAVIVNDGTNNAPVLMNGLWGQYGGAMNSRKRGRYGGSQPVGEASSADTMANAFTQYGWKNRAPLDATVQMPHRSVEGRTLYCNTDFSANSGLAYTPMQFVNNQVNRDVAPAIVTRPTNSIGAAALPCSAVGVLDPATIQPLTTAPGWPVSALRSHMRVLYDTRNRYVPFGRTLWAGWIPHAGIGQVGTVSYQLAIVDGQPEVFTISSIDHDDWLFTHDGRGISDAKELVSGKGMAAAYRSACGSLVVDVPPPNTRVFLARITGATQSATEAWRWDYDFIEVEPYGGAVTANAVSTIGSYARSGKAANMSEQYNSSLLGRIAPGVLQSLVQNATIQALPIDTGVLVTMIEQAPPANFIDGVQVTAPPPIKFWFTMPNAVRVTCNP
jgi:hypothetical protein